MRSVAYIHSIKFDKNASEYQSTLDGPYRRDCGGLYSAFFHFRFALDLDRMVLSELLASCEFLALVGVRKHHRSRQACSEHKQPQHK